jgi:hypothetical protein
MTLVFIQVLSSFERKPLKRR